MLARSYARGLPATKFKEHLQMPIHLKELQLLGSRRHSNLVLLQQVHFEDYFLGLILSLFGKEVKEEEPENHKYH